MGIFDTIPDDGPMNKGQEKATSSLFESHFAKSGNVKEKTDSIVSGRFCGCGMPIGRIQRMCKECKMRARG